MPTYPLLFDDCYIPEPNSGCWLWLRGLTAGGYGRVTINGERIYAHRWAYECIKGQIPPGLQIDHKCRVRSCVNPDHLEAVTQIENLRRGAGGSSRTHCPRGHPYNSENTRITARGRKCRACHREWENARYANRLKGGSYE